MLESELRAILAGLLLAVDLVFPEAVIVSDSVEAIWAIRCGCLPLARLARLAYNCLSVLLANRRWSLKHVLPEDNRWADVLASAARSRRWSWDNRKAIPRIISAAMAA